MLQSTPWHWVAVILCHSPMLLVSGRRTVRSDAPAFSMTEIHALYLCHELDSSQKTNITIQQVKSGHLLNNAVARLERACVQRFHSKMPSSSSHRVRLGSNSDGLACLAHPIATPLLPKAHCTNQLPDRKVPRERVAPKSVPVPSHNVGKR